MKKLNAEGPLHVATRNKQNASKSICIPDVRSTMTFKVRIEIRGPSPYRYSEGTLPQFLAVVQNCPNSCPGDDYPYRSINLYLLLNAKPNDDSKVKTRIGSVQFQL
ncbi:hypothetical protein ACJIZ3_004382 [Penstemon smallii]|uniref:Uncharacterized protein n=1 Tax=Penstemon smallii TaxID=265156 RepID=A0ABD3S220_9LAMI